MNDEQFEKIVASITEGIEAPKHRTALRAALLRKHSQMRRPYFTLQLPKFLTMKTAVLPLSTFAVLALVLVGTLGVTQKSAEAQELAQRAMTATTRLTPAMRAEIEANIKADMMKTLQEAYKAADLRILTKEEYEKEAQFTFSTSTGPHGMVKFMHKIDGEAGLPDGAPETIAFSSAHAVPIGEVHDVTFETKAEGNFVAGTMGVAATIHPPVKFLRYTDPDGRKVTLGLDETDTPVFLIQEMTSKDVIEGPDGTVTAGRGVFHEVRMQMQNTGGGYGAAGSIHVEAGGQEVQE